MESKLKLIKSVLATQSKWFESNGVSGYLYNWDIWYLDNWQKGSGWIMYLMFVRLGANA